MNDGYTKIKNILIASSELDDTEFRILCYLISISKKGMCYPSLITISKTLKSSKNTVIRKLKTLEEKGFILKENRTLGTGKKTSNIYLINEDAISKKLKKEIQSEANSNDEEFHITEEELKILDYDWTQSEE